MRWILLVSCCVLELFAREQFLFSLFFFILKAKVLRLHIIISKLNQQAYLPPVWSLIRMRYWTFGEEFLSIPEFFARAVVSSLQFNQHIYQSFLIFDVKSFSMQSIISAYSNSLIIMNEIYLSFSEYIFLLKQCLQY